MPTFESIASKLTDAVSPSPIGGEVAGAVVKQYEDAPKQNNNTSSVDSITSNQAVQRVEAQRAAKIEQIEKLENQKQLISDYGKQGSLRQQLKAQGYTPKQIRAAYSKGGLK